MIIMLLSNRTNCEGEKLTGQAHLGTQIKA